MPYRYISPAALPPPATPAQIAHLQAAAQTGQIVVLDPATRHVTGPFKTTLKQFLLAVHEHIASGRKIYRKYQTGSSILIPHKIQANVCLDEESGESSDVYVEFTLAAGGRVYIRDAHSHGNAPRLPL